MLCDAASFTCRAGNYLDRVVLHEEVPLIESFDVLVIACLRLGAKQCEKESAVPSARVFAEHCTARYGERDVARMEVSVLCSLGWVAHCSTAHDFYGSLVLGDLLRPGDAIGGQHGDARPIHRLSGPGALGASEEEVTVRKYAEFFLDLIVQEFAVDDQPASLNACSAVYAARMLLSICPTWAPELERETGYGSQALTNTVSHLLECVGAPRPRRARARESARRARGSLAPRAPRAPAPRSVFARDYSDDWARLHDRMLSRGAVSGKDAEMLPLPSPTFVDEQLALTAY